MAEAILGLSWWCGKNLNLTKILWFRCKNDMSQHQTDAKKLHAREIDWCIVAIPVWLLQRCSFYATVWCQNCHGWRQCQPSDPEVLIKTHTKLMTSMTSATNHTYITYLTYIYIHLHTFTYIFLSTFNGWPKFPNHGLCQVLDLEIMLWRKATGVALQTPSPVTSNVSHLRRSSDVDLKKTYRKKKENMANHIPTICQKRYSASFCFLTFVFCGEKHLRKLPTPLRRPLRTGFHFFQHPKGRTFLKNVRVILSSGLASSRFLHPTCP